MLSQNPRIARALEACPRDQFIASRDLSELISGHSIPTQRSVERLLGLVPDITNEQRVLHVGGGSGYLAAVLSHLSSYVYVLERQAPVADIAVSNLARAGIENVSLVVADAEAPFTLDLPCDLVICSTFLATLDHLLPALKDEGVLVSLEPQSGRPPALVLHRRLNDTLVRERTLGWIDFRRTTDEVLIDLGVGSEEKIRAARREAASKKRPIMEILRQTSSLSEFDLYRQFAQGKRGATLVDLPELLKDLEPEHFSRFSRTFLESHRLIPAYGRDKRLYVVSDDPDARTEAIERLTSYEGVQLLLVTPTDFRRLWSHLDIATRGASMTTSQLAEAEPVDDDALLGHYSEPHITPYLVSVYEGILLEAISQEASDIHIEVYGERVRLRLRVDGDLSDLDHYRVTPRELRGVINVVKMRAELNIAERRLPQGGRTRLYMGDSKYDLRVQTQPSLHGEHVVIRLLRQTGRAMTMSELGMSRRIAGFYQRLLDNPSGMVLVVGPTGSGKSTTLYAGLQELADDGRRKVITVEDPIEYSIDNIQQTRVRPDIGFSFADAMRSFVRQDPDVILVGEIRDRETALEAVRASQTGHILLSTLHCNDAVDALQRLFDLGMQPNSVASELLAVIAQRLAKRICVECREEVTPDPDILAELFPSGVPADFRCFAGKGCDHCDQTGTRGRVAVIEYMQVNADIRNAISRHLPIGEMRWRALDGGLATMRDSALDHVIAGTIPLSELPHILPQERMAPEIRGGRHEAL